MPMTSTTVQSFSGVVLVVRPIQWQLAAILARQRMKGHNHCRTSGQSLGSLRANFNAECWGSLGELVIYDALELRGARPDYTLLRDRPTHDPDMVLDHQRFEIKSSPPGSGFVYVNAEQHQKQTEVDYYVICLFHSKHEVSVCGPVPYAEVSRWKLITDKGHSPFYSTSRQMLRPLRSLDLLPKPSEQIPGPNRQEE
jgi:hypothetical protein